MRAPRPALALALLLLAQTTAAAQESRLVTPDFDGETWVTSRHRIALSLEPATAASARIAIFIGDTDYTPLFERRGSRLVFGGRQLPLPSGQQEVTVYTVTGGTQWHEAGRFPLRVLSPEGFEEVALNPRLSLSNKGQVAEGHTPSDNAPPRDAYQDFAVNTGFQSQHARSGWTVRTQANIAGASNRQEALRFGELQGNAPKFDLADYLLTVEHGAANLSVGHVSFGEHRHLLNGFGSRGITAGARIGSVAQLSAAAMNGNAIVGWANPFGLRHSDHRVVAGNLSVSPIAARPELVTLSAAVVGGSLRPRAGFNQGVISDAEKSTGGGVRLSVTDPSQRVRLEAGYSRSSFTNPTDPELAQGGALVPVARTERDAQYVDASLQLLREMRLPLPTSLSVTVQHERVEPLYRNVASPVSADVLQNSINAQGSIGPLSISASIGRSHDNLDEIASILTTHTHASSANATLPLATIFTKASWLPALSFGAQRTRQYGTGVPPNSDFAESHVPDQVSLTKTYGVQWQLSRGRLEYQRNDSDQDNRQAGRENADFLNTTNTIGVGINLLPSLDISADFGFDDATSEEVSQKNQTRRIGGALNWRVTGSTAVSSAFTRTRMKDEPLSSEQTASDLRVELSQRFPLIRRSSGSSPGQLFVRFSRQAGDFFSPFAERTSRTSWNVNTGLTIGVF